MNMQKILLSNTSLSVSLLSSWVLCALLLSACNDKNHKTNHAPMGADAQLTTQADTELQGILMGSDSDGDKLTYAVATQPTQGTVTVNTKGRFVYTPAADTTGTDQFTFTVSDGKLTSPTATVNVTINPLEVAFDAYSRKAYAQDSTAQPLPLNTRNVQQDVTDPTAYDDLLQ